MEKTREKLMIYNNLEQNSWHLPIKKYKRRNENIWKRRFPMKKMKKDTIIAILMAIVLCADIIFGIVCIFMIYGNGGSVLS